MKIYQTSDIPEAIRLMAARNELSIVFDYQWALRHVRHRLNQVADIPSVLVRPWDAFCETSVNKWLEQKGVMYYRHMPRYRDFLPESEAILFTDTPMQMSDLRNFDAKASNEIIIYRPPDWSMHQERVIFKYPSSEIFKRIFAAFAVLKEDDNLTKNQRIALSYCNFGKGKAIAFSAEKIAKLADISVHQFKRIFRFQFALRGHYHRYDCFRLMIEPKDKDLLKIYRLLENEDDIEGGIRMLRFGCHTQAPVKNYLKFFKIMVKQKCIEVYDPVHILVDGWKPMEYDVVDALVGVRRASCMEMRRLVEDAPVYKFD